MVTLLLLIVHGEIPNENNPNCTVYGFCHEYHTVIVRGSMNFHDIEI